MTTETILDIIYNYYPKNISIDDVDLYDTSIEYQNRLKKCEEAREHKSNWENFKHQLNFHASANLGDCFYDYSILGSEPCYCASLTLQGSPEPFIISILISVIIPLWAYRIVKSDRIRYKYEDKKEKSIVLLLELLITKYFPTHHFIKDTQHQIIVHDVDSVFQQSLTIFEAIFKGDLN